MKLAEVYAKHNRARVMPKKMAIVMDLIRNKKLHEAKVTLAFDSSKPAKFLLKVVKSAEANAVNNHGLKSENLRIAEVYVSEGKFQRYGRPGSKGRFDPLIKRTSHIVVGLSSKKEEGKVAKAKK